MTPGLAGSSFRQTVFASSAILPAGCLYGWVVCFIDAFQFLNEEEQR